MVLIVTELPIKGRETEPPFRAQISYVPPLTTVAVARGDAVVDTDFTPVWVGG